MSNKEKDLYAVFSEVRSCFNRLKALAEHLHRDLGINPSMRAVMEALAAEGEQTVPQIAKRKGVSRQHIQTIINALLEGGFVSQHDNPAHRRSPLFALTAKGHKTFADMAEREKAPLQAIARQMSHEALTEARDILAEVNAQLDRELTRKGNTG